MNKERILLLTAPRSGSTYICSMFNKYIQSTRDNYVVMPQEMLNYENWCKTKDKQLKNTHFFEWLGKDYDELAGSVEVMRSSFLKCTDQDNYIFKYFPIVMERVVRFDEIIEICKHHNIKIVVLYRRSLLESIVSILLSHGNDVWNIPSDSDLKIDPKKIDQNLTHIDYVIRTYKKLLEFVEQARTDYQIHSVLEYESLNYTVNDLDKILESRDKLIKIPPPTKKLTNSEQKFKILNDNPELKDSIYELLDKHKMSPEIIIP